MAAAKAGHVVAGTKEDRSNIDDHVLLALTGRSREGQEHSVIVGYGGGEQLQENWPERGPWRG